MSWKIWLMTNWKIHSRTAPMPEFECCLCKTVYGSHSARDACENRCEQDDCRYDVNDSAENRYKAPFYLNRGNGANFLCTKCRIASQPSPTRSSRWIST